MSIIYLYQNEVNPHQWHVQAIVLGPRCTWCWGTMILLHHKPTCAKRISQVMCVRGAVTPTTTPLTHRAMYTASLPHVSTSQAAVGGKNTIYTSLLHQGHHKKQSHQQPPSTLNPPPIESMALSSYTTLLHITQSIQAQQRIYWLETMICFVRGYCVGNASVMYNYKGLPGC